MHILILIVLVLAIIYGPQFWAQHILKRYQKQPTQFNKSGAAFARHLLDENGLHHVTVELTEHGDHYDPQAKCVRLGAIHYQGQSLTAITVAAHEVGHAQQDAAGYTLLALRGRLVKFAQVAEKLGSILMIAAPVIALLTRAPSTGVILFVAAILSMGVTTLVHLVTLPVELDASFGKALPQLKAGHYIQGEEEQAAARILKACAYTYLSASLASLFSLWRWLRFLRR